MKRKQHAKLFLLLILCTTYIFAFSHFGSNVYEAYSSTSNTFSKGTSIGPIDLSGKSKEEAIVLVTTQVDQWTSNATIELKYREKTMPFETKNFTFNILESIDLAIDGQSNPLLIQLGTEELQKSIVLLAPTVTVTEKLETDLLSIAQTLQVSSSINIDTYLSVAANMEVLSTFNVELGTKLDNLDNVSEIVIPGESSFSFSKFLTEANISDSPSSFINILSSGIYQLILQTNFTISERHIGAELPTEVLLGFEAKIDSNLGWDLAFYNPNQEDFSIKISQQEDYLQLDLIGYPFVNSYHVELRNEQSFERKTIKRYDPLLQPEEMKEIVSGKNGSYVEVYRKILSENGDWIGEELISKDFYAPQHRVESVGLTSPVVESEDSREEIEYSDSEEWNNHDTDIELDTVETINEESESNQTDEEEESSN